MTVILTIFFFLVGATALSLAFYVTRDKEHFQDRQR